MERRKNTPQSWPIEFDNIDLGQCSEEIEFISKKWALRAPKGKTFQVEGAFEIWDDSSYSNDYSSPPSESKQKFLSGNKVDPYDTYDFNNYLRYADGDEDLAFKMLEEDHGVTYTETFTGQWLLEDIDPTGQRNIIIRGPVHARVTSDMVAIDGSEHYTRYDEKEMWFFAEKIFAKWYQELVIINKSECTVSLVDDTDDTTSLYVPPAGLHEGLFLPFQRNDTFEGFFKRHGDILAYKYFDKHPDELSEREKLYFLRSWRNAGSPFSDDPLVDFKLPQSEPDIIIPQQKAQPEIIRSAAHARKIEMAKRALYFTANRNTLFPSQYQNQDLILE